MCFIAYAQNMTITGNVTDTLNNQPKKNTVVMLIRLSDSTLLDFQRTDENGKFNFELNMDTIEIIISHYKNDDKVIFFFPSSDRNTLDLSNTILPEKSEMMNEVTIYAYKDPVFFRGDTLVYLADSFKTKQNAVVEDLLKKLPGIEVDKNGSITSQGREVNKVLVDGDEFFGSDPTIATKNLGAKSIESVNIYEEENTDSDENSDETIQVMDLKLKEDAKKGYFGRLSGATDFDHFYEGEFLINRFNKDFKLSVFSLASNTPRANFGYGDIRKYGLSTKNNNFFSDNDREWWGYNNQNNNSGIPKTFKSGIFFSDKLTEKLKVGFNYTYNQSELDANSNKSLQYLLSDSLDNYIVNEENSSFETKEDHLVNFYIKYKLDSLTEIEIMPRYSESKTVDSSELINQFEFNDNTSNYNSIINQEHSYHSDNFSSEIRLKRNFKKKDRLLKYAYTYSQNNAKDSQFNLTNYTSSTSINNIDQNQNFLSNTINHQSQFLFREPITKKWGLDIEHLYKYSNGEQERLTYNFNPFESAYSEIDSAYSNEFLNKKITNRGGLFYVYKYRKDRFKLGGYVRNVQIENYDLLGNELTPNLNFWDILPQVNYRHKFSNSKRIRASYKTNSRQPSLNQLQPVQNNSNPNKITEGNPKLKPDYSHTFQLKYNNWKGITGSYIWSNLGYVIKNNAFSDSVAYDNFGRTISKTINIDRQDNAWFDIGGNIPIGNTPFSIGGGLFSNYFKTKSYINADSNFTTTFSNSGEISIDWDVDSIYFELGMEYSYSKPTNSLAFYNSQPYTTQEFFLDADVDLPWNMEFTTEATYTINSQRADGFNINIFIINLSLSKRFLNTENLILSFEGNDILNQNQFVQRSIQNNVIIDNRTQIISRYFLMRLTYRFNSNKGKIEDEYHH